MAAALFQGQHVRQGVPDPQIGIAGDKARLVVFHPADHLRLLFHGLGDEDEGDAALLGKADAHLLAGDRLHDGGNHGHVHGQGALLAAFELHHRGL